MRNSTQEGAFMRLLQRKVRCTLLVLLPAFLFGQADKGTLLGTVADASQAVIPQTIIRVTEINTGVSRSGH